MDRAHRRELKHDKFVEQVGHTLEYTSEHKSQVLRIGGAVLGVIVIAAGVYFYRGHQHSVRQADLREALRTNEAAVGPPNEYVKTFPTDAAKDQAVEKAFTEVATRHSGTDEGTIARFYLGTYYADKGRAADAEKHFKMAADEEQPFASQAAFSLAQLYESQGKYGEAEKLLKSLADKPNVLVSKEQATLALGRMYGRMGKPADARKVLEPLREAKSAVSRAAIAALAEVAPR